MTVQHAVKVFESSGFASPAQALVLLHLAYRADRRGIIRRAQSEIAADTGLSRSTVAKVVADLEANAVLSRQGHGRYQLDGETFANPDVPLDQLAPVPRFSRKNAAAADAELRRLQEIRTPAQCITYTPDGWPHLSLRSDYE